MWGQVAPNENRNVGRELERRNETQSSFQNNNKIENTKKEEKRG